jgi:hypothetical protein
MLRIIQKEFLVEGVLTDVTTAKLSDPTGTFGVKRNDTSAVVVVDGTNMTHSATGVYEYSFEDVQNVSYTAYVEFVYLGSTFHFEVDIPARAQTGAMVASYSSLLEIIGKKKFGIRTGFSSDQVEDIEDCMKQGILGVYAAHDWSFFKPVKRLSTTAPYITGTVTIVDGVVTLAGGTWPSWAADGVFKTSNNYYSIASRDSNSQLTLDDTSVDAAALTTYELARPEIPLDDNFEAIANDSDLTYYPSQGGMYQPVQQRHDQIIRKMQQNNPYYCRPRYYSVRTAEFEPTVGSRKRLAFYPTPDASYILRVPMILRPTMIDETNQYPVGGETLSLLYIEACLAAAERLLDDTEGIHTKRYWELLPLAIKADQEKSSPTSLGPDCPKGEYSGVYSDSDYYRAARIGDVSLDGEVL